MAFSDVFKCKVCGCEWEYSILCYIWTPPERQPQHKDDELCSRCDEWARDYQRKFNAGFKI